MSGTGREPRDNDSTYQILGQLVSVVGRGSRCFSTVHCDQSLFPGGDRSLVLVRPSDMTALRSSFDGKEGWYSMKMVGEDCQMLRDLFGTGRRLCQGSRSLNAHDGRGPAFVHSLSVSTIGIIICSILLPSVVDALLIVDFLGTHIWNSFYTYLNHSWSPSSALVQDDQPLSKSALSRNVTAHCWANTQISQDSPLRHGSVITSMDCFIH